MNADPFDILGDLVPWQEAVDLNAAKLASLGRRNVVRNGDMGITQRGAAGLTATGVMTADGWRKAHVGGTHTVDVPSSGIGAGLAVDGSFRMLRSVVAAQAAAADFAHVWQAIEGVRTLAGKQVTLSFLAVASAGTPKIGVELSQEFGTGGAPSAAVKTAVAAVQISAVAARYFVTFTVPSIAGKVAGGDGNDRLELILWTSAGANFAARASAIGIQNVTIDVTDVQLELGPDASPFERLPVSDQLAWCERYFYRAAPTASGMFIGNGIAAGGAGRANWRHPVIMRASPTVTWNGAATGWTIQRPSDNVAVDPNSIYAGAADAYAVNWGFDSTGNLGVGLAFGWFSDNPVTNYIDVSAEL